MPKLGKVTTKLILPSSKPKDEAWVKISKDLVAKDLLAIRATDKSSQEEKQNQVFTILASAIEDWNFVDDKGVKELITPENVQQLKIEDFIKMATFLKIDQIGLTVTKKKT